MHQRPDHSTLLDAVAGFLLSEVGPRLEADKALQFRVLIAANLASVVAGELRTHRDRLGAELARLQALLGHAAGAADEATLDVMNRELTERLRAEPAEGPAFAQRLEHLLQTARETLAVTNPRFELDHGLDPAPTAATDALASPSRGH